MSNPHHLSKTGEHYTPEYIVEAAREALGGIIHLDPASCFEANKTVKAITYFVKPRNDHDIKALESEWHGNVFLNPPGTCKEPDGSFPGCGSAIPSGKQRKVCGCDLVSKFWNKLTAEYRSGRVQQAIWIGFSLQQLQTLQKFDLTPMWGCLCIPKKRIAYNGASPPHASYICYLGLQNIRFEAAFQQIGECL